MGSTLPLCQISLCPISRQLDVWRWCNSIWKSTCVFYNSIWVRLKQDSWPKRPENSVFIISTKISVWDQQLRVCSLPNQLISWQLDVWRWCNSIWKSIRVICNSICVRLKKDSWPKRRTNILQFLIFKICRLQML